MGVTHLQRPLANITIMKTAIICARDTTQKYKKYST